jgi:glycerol-3-phosphate O-acyltransferase
MHDLREKAYYPFVLDTKPGFLLSWVLYRLFNRVQFDENMIEDLKRMYREGSVVYAIKYRSHLEYLLYHYRFRRSRLPYPKIAYGLNISLFLPLSQVLKIIKFHAGHLLKHGRRPSPFKTGFLSDAIEQGIPSLLCLIDPKGFARHFIHSEQDPLHFLINIQKKTTRPIYFVPLFILYKKTPEKDRSGLMDIFFGYKDKPGFIRKSALFFRHNRRAFIDFGSPLNLKSYTDSQPASRTTQDITLEIRQMLIDGIDRQKRVILGPVMKSRQQLKETVLKDGEVTGAIQRMARGNAKQRKQLIRKAGEYFDEIAADYNIAYIQFFHIALRWLWKKIFEGIEVDKGEMAVLREYARKGPLIYVPSHKSHIDYLVLNYVLYEHHMHVPRIAAGRNLAFWPMGHIFRKSGAFFIRRSFKGNRLYARVFTRYIKALLQEGHPLEFFIEGGRSRSGKLILPKIGFLSILIEAHREGYCDDLVFVPASISYDRILEEKSFLKELGGEAKEAESFQRFFGARRFLKRTYGRIYIRFAAPVSIKAYLSQEREADENAHRDLALHLIRSINRVTLVTPLALMASAILTAHRRGFHLHEVGATARMFLEFVNRFHIPSAPTLQHLDKAVRETLMLLINSKVVNLLQDVDEAETFYYVEDEKKRELEYYKNSIIHYFIPHAFVAVSLLTGSEAIKTREAIVADYTFLKTVFRHEFVYEGEEIIQQEIDEVIDYFLEASYITGGDATGGYTTTRLGFDKLPVWGAMAKTFIESYWIATRSFIQSESKPRRSRDLIKNMNYLGLRFHKLGLIDHMEAVSQVTFKNAIQFLNETVFQGRRTQKEGRHQAIEKVSRLSQRLYEFTHSGG